MIGIIYCIKNSVNHKVYIGQTVRPLKHRLACHRHDAYNSKRKNHNSYLNRAIRKYGWERFECIVLDNAFSLDQLNEKEKSFVALTKSNRREFGYNESSGGEGCAGIPPSKEWREKISKANKGRKFDEDHKRKLSENHSGGVTPKPILNIEKNITFESINSAAKNFDIDKKGISLCCRNLQETSGGYHWRYV